METQETTDKNTPQNQNDNTNSTTVTTINNLNKKPISKKQYDHLAKAREAKKRKADDSLETCLIDIRNYIKEFRDNNLPSDKIITDSAVDSVNETIIPKEKKSRLYDSIISVDTSYILPGLAVLSMVTLGSIGFSRYCLNKNNMYDYL